MSAVHINGDQYHSLTQQERPALVVFHAPWCGYCRKIEHAYDRIARSWADQLAIATVNIDDHPELAHQLEIEVVPTLILYRGGRELDSIVAPESQSMIEDFLHRNLSKGA